MWVSPVIINFQIGIFHERNHPAFLGDIVGTPHMSGTSMDHPNFDVGNFHMGVSSNIGLPELIHFSRVFPYKPCIGGSPFKRLKGTCFAMGERYPLQLIFQDLIPPSLPQRANCSCALGSRGSQLLWG